MKRIRTKANLQRANDLPWVTAHFESCLHKARQVEDAILSECKTAGYPEHDLFAIKLAIEEALVNAVKHGNCNDKTKSVKVQYRITPERCDITVEDEGTGFDPAGVPDPTDDANIEENHGRGILLMRAYMSNVVYSPQGNRVTLTKFNDNAANSAANQAAIG